MKIQATIERIIFSNSDNGYTIAKVLDQKKNEIITVTGFIRQAEIGKSYMFTGEWIIHAVYGKQFNISSYHDLMPNSLFAVEKYLGSGNIKGIGPKYAKKITEYFGNQTLEILETAPERINEVSGIGKKKINKIIEKWNSNNIFKNLELFFHKYSLPIYLISAVIKKYQNEAINIIQKNPYQLIYDIKGIGFIKADTVAQKMGIDENSNERLKAAIHYSIQLAINNGHCYLLYDQILKSISTLLKKNITNRLESVLVEMNNENNIYIFFLSSNDYQSAHYYSPIIASIEKFIAEKIKKLIRHNLHCNINHINAFLKKPQTYDLITTSKEQNIAITGLACHSMSILTGGPGVGKSTTLKCLIKLFESLNITYKLAAPTGRAAQRITEITNQPASTLHRLLQINDSTKSKIKLSCDALIVDEATMIDLFIMKVIVQSIEPGQMLILIGDPDQLPSVGVGNVLHDLIDCKKIPVYKLTKVFRQEKNSHIIKFAHMINNGIIPKIPSALDPNTNFQSDTYFFDAEEPNALELKLIKKMIFSNSEPSKMENHSISKEYIKSNVVLTNDKLKEIYCNVIEKIHPFSTLHQGISASDYVVKLITELFHQQETQVLCPKKNGTAGTVNLNQKIQNSINPLKDGAQQIKNDIYNFRINDRVMQIKNNYQLNVFNGDIGKIIDLNAIKKEIKVAFNTNPNELVTYNKEMLSELTLSYAITIHKSQGTEYDCVIIPILTQANIMLQRNLIYTALTRAKKKAIFIGTRKAFAMAIKCNNYNIRQSNLNTLIY